MKRIVLVFLIFSLLSCSKNDNIQLTEVIKPEIAEKTEVKLIGTWLPKSSTYEYYNEAGLKLHVDSGVSTATILAFDGTGVKGMQAKFEDSRKYIITNNNGIETIIIGEPANVTKFMIKALTKTAFTFSISGTYGSYSENGATKSAATHLATFYCTRVK